MFPPNDLIVKMANKFDHFSTPLKVIDKNLQEIGMIKEIFGPVNAPFVSIRPKIEIDASLRGQPVYIVEKKSLKK